MAYDRNLLLVNEELFSITRKIFYYGCYSAKDFERIDGIKPNVFSRYKNFLLQTLGNHIEEFTLSDGKTGVLRFRTNEFETPFNILLSLYTLKKISEQDFLFFIETMLFFTGTNEENYVPLAKLTESLKIPSKKKNIYISEHTFQRNLKELTDYGYLSCSGKKKFFYTKPESLLVPLEKEELYLLSAFIDLCRNFCHPPVCGHYLMDTISLVNRSKDLSYEGIFRCRHLHMGQVLEDGKLWQLITAIDNGKIIRFSNKKGEMRFRQPYKIIINETDGRRYLFCIPLEKTEEPTFLYRLDKIFEIQEEEECPYEVLTKEQAAAVYARRLGNSFTGTTVLQGELQNAVLLYRHAFYPEIRKHFSDAVPEHVDKTHDKISINVNSLKELKPWLRKNFADVRMTESSDDTAQELADELQDFRKMYGII